MDLPRLRPVWTRVFLAYAWMALVVIVGFRYSGWVDRAAEMMAERGSDDASRSDGSSPADGPPDRVSD